MDSNELRKLADVLDSIAHQAKKEMGYTHVSGGFSTARLSSYDSKAIDVVLRFGVQSDCTNIVHTEKLQVNRKTMELMPDHRESAMKKQLETVVAEMYNLIVLWDEEQVKQYPTYLPSFDEFIIEFANIMKDKG